MTGSPTIRVHRSNRTEALADALGELLDTPAGGPFDAECIVVQSHGMATWLAQQMARRHGVWAHADFPFPRHFVERAYRAVLGEDAARGYSRDRLLWAVLTALPDCLPRPAFARLRGYLGDDPRGVRRFQLGARIARLFDQYLTYRPEMVRAWEAEDDGDLRGRGQGWQPELWRALAARLGGGHLAAGETAFHDAVRRGAPAEDLPRRVALFGISSLPPLYLRVLAALARLSEVHLFVLAPARGGAGEGQAEHALLASLGRLGVEFEQVLRESCAAAGVGCEQRDRSVPPGARTMLGRLQLDLLEARAPGKRGKAAAHPGLPFAPRRAVVDPADRSVGLHSCHGPMREVEVLHDQLLDLLAQDTGIEPRDVVVMMPEVETYAPLVEAVFGSEREGTVTIPYRIADRRLRSESPVVEALQRMLALVDGRARASEILDLLRLEPVYRRFGLQATDLEELTQWVTASGVRWGVDAADRERHGQPAVAENTWRFGLTRMLLGYGMPGEGSTTFAGVLPYDEIEGVDAALLGRLAEFCERLFGHLEGLRAPRRLPEWRDAIGALLEGMLAQDPRTAWQHQRVRAALAEMVEVADEMEFGQPIDLAVLRSLLEPQIDEALPERGFLSGGVTFCAFVPMRSIPFQVVCMLGMSDGAFPRSDRPVDFDLIAAAKPRPGDRQRRADDRYLFLEALLAARRQVIITFTGQSIRDNRAQPPSVVVSELVEALARRFDAPPGQGEPPATDAARAAALGKHLVVRHPLQGFSRSYFEPGGRLHSYAEHYRQGAASLAAPRAEVPRLFTGPLPASGADAEPRVLALDELVRFVGHPIRYLLNRRLSIYLRDTELDIPDRESLELDPLERYQVGDRLLDLRLRDVGPADSLVLERAQGALPPGPTGDHEHARLLAVADEIARMVREHRGEPRPALPVQHDLPGGVRLVGALAGRFAPGLVRHQYSTIRGKHLLELWVRHLVQCWVAPPDEPRESLLFGREKRRQWRKGFVDTSVGYRFLPVDDPATELSKLVALLRVGLRAPLLLLPRTSLEYVLTERGGKHDPLARARGEWNGRSGERAYDEHLGRVLGDLQPPFEDVVTEGPGFAELARAVFGPLLDHREAV